MTLLCYCSNSVSFIKNIKEFHTVFGLNDWDELLPDDSELFIRGSLKPDLLLAYLISESRLLSGMKYFSIMSRRSFRFSSKYCETDYTHPSSGKKSKTRMLMYLYFLLYFLYFKVRKLNKSLGVKL